MKKLLVALMLVAGLSLASSARADEVRADDATDVAAFLGLDTQDYRVVSTEEAAELRGTGGLLGGGGLLGIVSLNANVKAKAHVNVLSVVKTSVHANVKANALAIVGLH